MNQQQQQVRSKEKQTEVEIVLSQNWIHRMVR